MVDYNDADGEKTCAEFRNKFGESNIIFCKCDVSDSAQLEGMAINWAMFTFLPNEWYQVRPK